VFTGLFDAQVLVLTWISLTGLKRYAHCTQHGRDHQTLRN